MLDVKALAGLLILVGIALCAWGAFGGPAARAAESAASPTSPRLVGFADVERDIAGARVVTLSAYALSENSRVVEDLLAAARRGAKVSVALSGSAMAYALKESAGTAARLRSGGVRVHVLAQALHMKAAVIDGERVYVSDRNWSSRGPALILGLPAKYRLIVERAIEGRAGRLGTFTTVKAQSLVTEGEVFLAGAPLVVQTESFNANASQVGILERYARAGAHVELIVARTEYERSPRERAQLTRLAQEGVRVDVSSADEKIAVGPSWAWCGSTNLSTGVDDQIDWGFATRDPNLVAALRAQVVDAAARSSNASL